MENIKNNPGSDPTARAMRAAFSVDALARILSDELGLTPATPLYVAYSGGLDSHVLLHALASLRAHAPWAVQALHVDHGLQPASAEWTRHCADVCRVLNIPFQSERVSVERIDDHGLEDAARRARYAALTRLLPADAVLLTAHHQDDQAETILLQLLRGAGVHGLAGMPAVAPFGSGRHARPLLGVARTALAEYAQAQRLSWIEDASNADTRLSRNFLRHRLWPVLRERWPDAAVYLARAARHQAEAAKLLDERARLDMEAVAGGEGELSSAGLNALSPERQANCLRYWIRIHGLKLPSEAVLREVLARVRHEPETRQARIAWPGAEVRRHRDRLALFVPEPELLTEWEAEWRPDAALDLPAGWRLRAQPAIGRGLSRARVANRTLQVRLRRGGERCLLRGHHHKKLLQDAGVPPWERARLPLVYIDGDLAAIGDRWVCQPYGAAEGEAGLELVIERNC
jgi:tRNA(Ile)-lysidine synthase